MMMMVMMVMVMMVMIAHLDELEEVGEDLVDRGGEDLALGAPDLRLGQLREPATDGDYAKNTHGGLRQGSDDLVCDREVVAFLEEGVESAEEYPWMMMMMMMIFDSLYDGLCELEEVVASLEEGVELAEDGLVLEPPRVLRHLRQRLGLLQGHATRVA
jgi:hypothetical protein